MIRMRQIEDALADLSIAATECGRKFLGLDPETENYAAVHASAYDAFYHRLEAIAKESGLKETELLSLARSRRLEMLLRFADNSNWDVSFKYLANLAEDWTVDAMTYIDLDIMVRSWSRGRAVLAALESA